MWQLLKPIYGCCQQKPYVFPFLWLELHWSEIVLRHDQSPPGTMKICRSKCCPVPIPGLRVVRVDCLGSRFSSQGSTCTKAGLTARLITIWPRLANAWEASSLVKLMARLLPNQYVANSGGTMRVSTGAGFSLSLQIHSSGLILDFVWYPTQFTVVMRSTHRLWYPLFQFPCYILVVQLGAHLKYTSK